MSHQAGLYLRVSEDRTGQGLAVERQREDCQKLVDLRGWTVAEEFIDNDISAAGRKKRPAFEALLRAVQDGRVTVIVAYAADRLGRNRLDHLRLMETCQTHRVSLALVRGADVDMTSAVGRGFADMMATWARMENEQKSERQRAQIRQAAEAGQLGGGAPRAFGYQAGGLALHPIEGPLLTQCYERWLAGSGLEELADWLNRQGVPTPRGKRWRSNTVSIVLRNPRNAGLRAMRPVVNEETGQRSTWHDPPIAEAVWPGAVSVEVWQAAMSRLRDPNREGTRNQHLPKGPTPRYLLSGIARCGQCGQHMITGGSHGVRRLNCITKRHMNRRADYVEAYVVERLLRRVAEPDAHELLLPSTEEGPHLDAVYAEQLAKRQKLLNLVPDYNDGVIDREQMKASGSQLRARLAELDAVVAKAGRVDVVAPLVTAEDAGLVWDGYLVSTRRLVIGRLMRITIHRASPGRPKGGVYDTSTIEIRWRDQRLAGPAQDRP